MSQPDANFDAAAPRASTAMETAANARLEPQFPARVPQLLRWNSSTLGLLAAAAGILMGLGISVAVYSFVGNEQVWARLFDLDHPQSFISVAMVCMFIWGIAICIVRWLRLRQIERISGRAVLLTVSTALADTNASLAAIVEQFSGPVTAASPLLRRVHAALRQWDIQPGLLGVSALLDQHAVTDEEATRSAYSAVRTFVWALPVLGLIGTVVGIAIAVSDFSSFLGTDVDDVTAIKTSLISVTAGLAFAFAATLLGLAGSLLLMLPAAALQSREERFYNGVQQHISDAFLPALQRRFPETVRSGPEPFDGFRDILAKIAKEMIDKLGETLDAVSQGFLRQVQEFAVAVLGRIEGQTEKLLGEIQAVMDRGTVKIDEVLTRICAGLDASSADFLRRLEEIRRALADLSMALQSSAQEQMDANMTLQGAVIQQLEALKESAKAVVDSLDVTAKAVSDSMKDRAADLVGAVDRQAAMNNTIHDDLLKAIEVQADSVKSVIVQISGLTDSTLKALEAQEALESALMTLAPLPVAIEGTTASFDQMTAQMSSNQSMTQESVSVTEKVLLAQAALHKAIGQLDALGLTDALASLTMRLEQVSGVLTRFQEPIVFQAVPVRLLNTHSGEDGV